MPEKISILKESGETLSSNVVSVFMIPDTEKKYIITTENAVDPHGLTVLHVSEIVDGTLQKIATDDEWSSIKTIMRAIISGNVGSYQYLPTIENINASGQYSRDISVSASAAKQMVDEFGEESLYMVNDYSSGGMDAYMGQRVLFLDEFRGQIPYHVVLSWLDGYKVQVHARYSNVLALWDEVHISSVVPPEKVYEVMVFNNRDVDSAKQLFRRVNSIIYHWKNDEGFHQYELAGKDYRNLEDLRCRALGVYDDFQPLPEYEQQTLPFANVNS